MNKILVVVSFVFVSFLSCTGLTDRQRLANQILSDTNLLKVDSMARATIRNGFNAGSGYSQIWARDMNTFIEIACEESDPHELREAILLFFALQQPNDEMIDGYVLKGDFTWYDDTPYYSNAAPKHVAFKNTVETDQESSLIQIVGKYIRKTGDREILNEKVAGKTVLERMNAMVDYLMRERYNEKYGLLYGAMTADWGDVQPNDDFGCDMNDLSDPAICWKWLLILRKPPVGKVCVRESREMCGLIYGTRSARSSFLIFIRRNLRFRKVLMNLPFIIMVGRLSL